MRYCVEEHLDLCPHPHVKHPCGSNYHHCDQEDYSRYDSKTFCICRANSLSACSPLSSLNFHRHTYTHLRDMESGWPSPSTCQRGKKKIISWLKNIVSLSKVLAKLWSMHHRFPVIGDKVNITHFTGIRKRKQETWILKEFRSFYCGSLNPPSVVSVRMLVRSLASLSGVRIRRCHTLPRVLQMHLESRVVVVVV